MAYTHLNKTYEAVTNSNDNTIEECDSNRNFEFEMSLD